MPEVGTRQRGTERPGKGWLECIGLSLKRADYPELFEAIGTRYGALNEEHFNLPSEPLTYIYAGGDADSVPETPPQFMPGTEPAEGEDVRQPDAPVAKKAEEKKEDDRRTGTARGAKPVTLESAANRPPRAPDNSKE